MFCTNEDVQRYVPEADDTLADRARWIADTWILGQAPMLNFLGSEVHTPPAAQEASALLAAVLLSEDLLEWPMPRSYPPPELIPNMVRLMLVPWQ